MKHTKGKWMVAIIGKTTELKSKFQIVSDISYTGIMGGDTETPICNILQYNSHEESEANAKLIAEAPELLEAMKKLDLEVQRRASWFRYGESPSRDKLNWLLREVQKATAIIKKAAES